jgi:hypothetical protein
MSVARRLVLVRHLILEFRFAALRLTNGKPALARWIGEGSSQFG